MATKTIQQKKKAQLAAAFAKKKAEQTKQAAIGPARPIPQPLPEPPNAIEKKVRTATRKDVNGALAWFYNEIKGELGADGRAKSRIRRIPDKAFRPSRDAFIGQVFFFVYDAKYKDELPYWDQFPLVIPIKPYDNGFLGLNLHYLPPLGRAKLLDMLKKYKKYSANPRAYMKISYEILKSAADHHLFKPCVHRYLTTHIKSDLVKVLDDFWDRAALLPVQKFVGATAKEVWQDSFRGKVVNRRKKKK